MKKLIFNNIFVEDIGLIVVEGPSEILAQEEYEEIDVEGRNGKLIINKGSYPDTIKTFKLTSINYEDDEDIELMIENINNWLFDMTDNKLLYTYDSKYNIAKKVVIAEDVKTTFEEFGDFTVNFICEPFYYDLNEYPLILTSHENIFYKGTVKGEPNIKIYGSGNIQLTINSETVQINNVNEYVELDSKLLLCLNSDKTSKSRDMIGNFPLLTKGINNISWTGNVSKVEILPRTAYR